MPESYPRASQILELAGTWHPLQVPCLSRLDWNSPINYFCLGPCKLCSKAVSANQALLMLSILHDYNTDNLIWLSPVVLHLITGLEQGGGKEESQGSTPPIRVPCQRHCENGVLVYTGTEFRRGQAQLLLGRFPLVTSRTFLQFLKNASSLGGIWKKNRFRQGGFARLPVRKEEFQARGVEWRVSVSYTENEANFLSSIKTQYIYN